MHHLVTLHYTQPAPTDLYQRRLQPDSGGAYRDYLQLFVPAGATLTSTSIDGAPGSPEDITTTLGLTDIAFFTIINPGTSRTLSIGYNTHPALAPTSFVLGKQLQSLPHPVSAEVTWADGKVSRSSLAHCDAALVLAAL